MVWILILIAVYLTLGLASMRQGPAFRAAVALSFVLVVAMRLTM